MRLIVNALPLQTVHTGIARYIANLYKNIVLLFGDSSVEVIHYFDGFRIFKDLVGLSDVVNCNVPKIVSLAWKLPDVLLFMARSVRWLFYEKNLRRVCRKNLYYIYHETSFSPAAISDIPTVFNIFDLSLIRFKGCHPRERVWYFNVFFRRRIKYAYHILTSSQFVREEICDILRIPEDMVTAVYLAPDESFKPVDPVIVEAVKHNLHLPNEYILFVGTLEPRKNIISLIKALRLCKCDIPLVLVGWDGWGDKPWMLEMVKLGLSNRVIAVGYVTDEVLAALYSGAKALVYPSLYEGFGLPVVEAMACGCPVICSNTSSMPEVTGDAAFLINPLDEEEIAFAIDTVLEDEYCRNKLVERGLQRASEFDWKITARKTIGLFERVYSEFRK